MDLLIDIIPDIFENNELPKTKDGFVDLLVKSIHRSDLDVHRDFIYGMDRRGNDKPPVDLVIFGDEPPLSPEEAGDPRRSIVESCDVVYGPDLDGYEEDKQEFLDTISLLTDFSDSFGRATDEDPCVLFLTEKEEEANALNKEVFDGTYSRIYMHDLLEYITPSGKSVYILICSIL